MAMRFLERLRSSAVHAAAALLRAGGLSVEEWATELDRKLKYFVTRLRS
jgi:hypothetical protein